jgi:endonuclease/exonuclease/phosphatase (EEP) superfamily protein YafD
MRVEVAAGTFVDVYNLHADAGSAPGDVSARASNLEQLAQAIVARSAGRAVIVAGDFNARYTRAADTMHALLSSAGLRDAWADLTRDGMVPRESEVVACSTEPDDPACERIDKVLYRGADNVGLRPLLYEVAGARFVDAMGMQLSDHRPVAVRFALTLPAR